MLRTLGKQIKEYKKASILTPVFVTCEVIMELLIPILMAKIIDDGIGKGNDTLVYKVGALMAVLAMLSLLFGILNGKYAAEASTGFAKNLRKGMYENIQNFSFSNIDKYSTAGLVTRMTTDVTNVQNAYQMIIRMCARAPMMLIIAVIMSISISPKLSMIFIVAIIFLGGCLALIIYSAFGVFDKVFKKYDNVNASVQENVNAIRVVKAYVREDYENKKFNRAIEEVYRLFVKAESRVTLNNPVMMVTVYGCILALSWFGAKMIVVNELTTGELVSLFSYIMNIMISLMMISMAFVMITMARASAERIAEVLNEKSDLTNNDNPVYSVKNGDIDFNQVNFKYKSTSEEMVLSDIDVHIKSGETIGIIGGTGSSKSSFVNLISRLYDVTDGEVKVGGINVKDYDIETLRNEVSVVLQKNVLFSGTIKENLRWGNKNATDEELVTACKLACADEFIEKFPDGYDTYIEQGGSNVSGGQKQRLCIARALLKKPKILILDDSTSAVDTATDAKIRANMKKSIPGTTKLIIAQRISSVQESDKIIVLDDGHIDGFGTHEELLANNEIYKEVYYSQTKGDE
ncbi:MAG: ABC transporter ATP-binding protein [Lachnospiraceae bacterium]|nr:ABC transporter ATP-binding protein/permease [Clostridiales bacterium]MDY2607941.1 ABC transporter ATP-binding protein [Lachnospiraceae bacterium]